MRIDQALVNLLGEPSSKLNHSSSFSSRDNFESTLDIISNRSITNGTNTLENNNRRSQRNLRENLDNRMNTSNNPTRTRGDETRRETNHSLNGSANHRTNEANSNGNRHITSEGSLEDELEEKCNEVLCCSIIFAIASVLNIPETDIRDILGSLNITPDELNNSNLREFLKEVYNVEAAIDLLDIPNISELLSNLETSLKKAYTNVEKFKSDLTNKSLLGDTDKSLLGDTEVLLTEEKSINGIGDHANITEIPQGNESSSSSEDTVNNTASNNSKGVEIETNQPNMVTQSLYKDINLQKSSIDAIQGDYIEGQLTFSRANTSSIPKATSLKSQDVQSFIVKDIINQIQGKIKADIKGTVSEIRMLLKPENLGEISLKVLTENGIVTAKILADNHKVKEILESNLNELKQSLSENGIEVTELSVSVGQDDSSQRQLENFFKEQEKSKLRISQIVKNIMTDTEMNEEDTTNNSELDFYDSSVNYTI